MDVYVSMSQGEGYGIPQAEALAAGIPIIYLDDNGASRELIGDAGIAIPPLQYEPWKIGIELPVPDVKAFAKTVNTVYNDKELLKELSNKSLARSKQLTWTELHTLLGKLINQLNG